MRLITLCEVLFIAAVVYQAVQWRYTGIAIHLCKMQECGVDAVTGAATFFDYVEFMQNQPAIHFVNT